MDLKGLNDEEVIKNRKKYGSNSIENKNKKESQNNKINLTLL